MVDTVPQHRMGQILEISRQVSILTDIVLRVKIQFHRHGAGNTAGIDVPLYGSAIAAIRSRPHGDGIILLRSIHHPVLIFFTAVPQQVGDHAKLVIDPPQRSAQGITGSVYCGMDGAQFL